MVDACPHRPFRPFALLLWGAKPDTFVRQLRIGWEAQLTRIVPGFEFEADVSWDEFRDLCIPRPCSLLPAIEPLREVGVFHRLDLATIETDMRVELTVEGPIEHAVLIGDVPRIEERFELQGSKPPSEGSS